MAFGTLKTIDLICPHCGYKLGEQRLFQEYEQRVAAWLNGEVCAVNTANFDVWKCPKLPALTFQVKYANVYHHSGKGKNSRLTWQWHGSNRADHDPDYFVLFGIQDNGTEHCFLLGLNQWLNLSSKDGEGKRHFIIVSHPYSRRGRNRGNPSGYLHENRGWKYEVKNPEENLIERIRTLESYRQFELFGK